MATLAEVLITDGLIRRPMGRDMTAAEPASFRSDGDRILGVETEGSGVSEGSHTSRTARKGGSEARDGGWLASPVAEVRGESRALPGVQGEPWAEGLAGWTRQGVRCGEPRGALLCPLTWGLGANCARRTTTVPDGARPGPRRQAVLAAGTLALLQSHSRGALCNNRTFSYGCRGQTDPRFLLFSPTTNFAVPWDSWNWKLIVQPLGGKLARYLITVLSFPCLLLTSGLSEG